MFWVPRGAGGIAVNDLICRSDARIWRVVPCYRLSLGGPRVDLCNALSGLFFVIRNGLLWRDAPARSGPHMAV